jgi:tetratricopeptide (TPR) repeat protein
VRQTPEERVADARAHAEAGRWSDAAALYASLADEAVAGGDADVAAQCLALGGDALRRDDRPAAAARLLRRSLDLGGEVRADGLLSPRRLAAEVELAGTLIDAGYLADAVAMLRVAVAGAATENGRTLALDALISALVPMGRIAEAKGVLLELSAVAPPGARIAVAFRQALMLRLDGHLAAAGAAWRQVLDNLPESDALAGPRAAAWGGLGELALLQGDGGEAERCFAAASAMWTLAGRRSGVFRAAAGSLRASLLSGARVLPHTLDGPIRFAEERQSVFLEIELRLARGQARARNTQSGADTDLDRAVHLAHEASALLLEGQARVVRRAAGFRWDDLARARFCLADDRVWLARVAPG